MPDPHNLQRFLEAQALVYDQVLTELRHHQKTTHWIWFIFPQLAGLGASPTSQRFAIESLEEATAYLAHPILGPRLIECTQLVLAAYPKPVLQILGTPDDLKFRSSMTLFAHTPNPNPIFTQAISIHFHGESDNLTLKLLGISAPTH